MKFIYIIFLIFGIILVAMGVNLIVNHYYSYLAERSLFIGTVMIVISLYEIYDSY